MPARKHARAQACPHASTLLARCEMRAARSARGGRSRLALRSWGSADVPTLKPTASPMTAAAHTQSAALHTDGRTTHPSTRRAAKRRGALHARCSGWSALGSLCSRREYDARVQAHGTPATHAAHAQATAGGTNPQHLRVVLDMAARLAASRVACEPSCAPPNTCASLSASLDLGPVTGRSWFLFRKKQNHPRTLHSRPMMPGLPSRALAAAALALSAQGAAAFLLQGPVAGPAHASRSALGARAGSLAGRSSVRALRPRLRGPPPLAQVRVRAPRNSRASCARASTPTMPWRRSPLTLGPCLPPCTVCVFVSWQSGTPLDQARAKPPLDLTEENVVVALEEAKEVLGTIFGNTAENRKIGITGDVQVLSCAGRRGSRRRAGRARWRRGLLCEGDSDQRVLAAARALSLRSSQRLTGPLS